MSDIPDIMTTEDTKLGLGVKLKEARQEAQLKQEQVARYLQVPASAISAMETGHRKIDAVELFYLSKLYGKPIDWFFDETHPLSSKAGVRWYDNDPLIREVIFLLQKAPSDLRKKAAYGILGFLGE